MNTSTTNSVVNTVNHTITAKLEEIARLVLLGQKCGIEVSAFLMGTKNEWLSLYCKDENLDVLVNIEEQEAAHELNKLFTTLKSFIPAAAAAHKEDQELAFFNEQNQPFGSTSDKLVLEEINEIFKTAKIVDPDNAELNQTQTSDGMDADPIQDLLPQELASMITTGDIAPTKAFSYVQSTVSYGEYTPLNLWPSESDKAKSTGLNVVCEKLAEAELYISLLLAEKAA